MIDLGTLGGSNSSAIGINNRSEVVGSAALATEEGQAFLWRPYHGLLGIGSLTGEESWARDINARGEIVGRSVIAGIPVAVLWTKAARTQ
jgi:probable HAF family extracellular repeat protein